MNQTEKVAKKLRNGDRLHVGDREYLLSLIDQQGEPVGWVHRHQLALLNNPKTIGIEAMVYRHEPKAYDPPGAFVPLYLHPPASREREALEEVVTFVKECATPPYPNSNAVSLLEWVEGRASYLLRNNAMLAQEADDGK